MPPVKWISDCTIYRTFVYGKKHILVKFVETVKHAFTGLAHGQNAPRSSYAADNLFLDKRVTIDNK